MKKILVRNIVSLQQELLTVVKFYTPVATGDCICAWFLNDNNDMTTAAFNAEGKYAQVDLGRPMVFKQYRHTGCTNNNQDGGYKLQYWDAWKQDWIDWVTGLVTRSRVWSAWTTTNCIESQKIRVVCTTVDSGGNTLIGELAVKY